MKYIDKNIGFGMSASAVVLLTMFAVANADGGTTIPNSKCVTVVGPQTCGDGGNSVCTAGVMV